MIKQLLISDINVRQFPRLSHCGEKGISPTSFNLFYKKDCVSTSQNMMIKWLLHDNAFTVYKVPNTTVSISTMECIL